MGRMYAGILGLIAFATVVARAVFLGGDAEVTLWTATWNSLLFALLGGLAGRLAEQTIIEGVRIRFEQELNSRAEAPEVSPR